MMDTSEIKSYMKNDRIIRKQLGDVCAADELPIHIRYRPRIYIVNTDKRHQPGQHWVVFYFPKRGPAEFFDSNGYPPDYYHRRFKRVLVINGRSYKHNGVKLQEPGTITCGQFCLFYAYHRCRGYSMNQIVNVLGHPRDNEHLVTYFVRHYFHM